MKLFSLARSKIAVEVLDDEILVTMPGTSFSIVYVRTKDDQLVASYFWKKDPGRKKQGEFRTFSFTCLGSGKREGKRDRLDSLSTN